MKRILFSVLLSGMVLVSCKKDITDLNQNPKQPDNVTVASLYAIASINLADVLASPNVNTNIFRLFAQQWSETTYPDETNYDLDGRSIPDRWFTEFYRDVIKDLAQAAVLLETEKNGAPLMTEAEYKNRKAQIEMLQVFAYYHLVTTFGNIPYSEALNPEIIQPKYDDAATVYNDLITRLDAALALVDPGEEGFGSADIMFNGDMAAWETFGNSLKMRMGMLILDSDLPKATAMILAAAPKVVSSNDENLKMNFLASPPNTNPIWEDLVQSGRYDFVGSNTLVNQMKALNDPRIPLYFEKNENGDYLGGIYGSANTYINFSAPSATITRPDYPLTFFSYAEMEFYKAEAVARGIAVGGTAEEHYNNAIDASIEEWGGTPAQALAYRSQPSVKWTTNAEYKQKIGVQSWIALYNRGYDAWTQWRRLDYPQLLPPPDGLFANGETPGVPVRYTYPVVEQNLNKANYTAAAGAIGLDRITQKLWFDKF
jgi:hypothetical protein